MLTSLLAKELLAHTLKNTWPKEQILKAYTFLIELSNERHDSPGRELRSAENEREKGNLLVERERACHRE